MKIGANNMIVYYSLFGLIILMLALYKYTRNKVFFIAIFILLFFVGAFRFDVGKDYSTYYKVITNYSTRYALEYERFELLNKPIILIARLINFPQFYFIAMYAITMFFYYFSIDRESKDKSLSLLLFISFPVLYIYAFSAIRQYVALAIVMFSMRYIFEEKKLKFIISIIVATLFHKSAILCLPMYLLRKINISKTIMFISMIIVPLLSEVIKELILNYYRISYFYKDDAGQGRKIFMFIALILIISILFKSKLMKIDHRSNFYINSLFVGYLIISLLLANSDMGIRLGTYYIQFLIFLIPLFTSVLESKMKMLTSYMLFIICILMFFMTINSKNIDPHKTQIIPYRIFINKDVGDLYYD